VPAANRERRRIVMTESRFESRLPTRPAFQVFRGHGEFVTVEAGDNLVGAARRPKSFGFVISVGHTVAPLDDLALTNRHCIVTGMLEPRLPTNGNSTNRIRVD
jgi:hypothetical protein